MKNAQVEDWLRSHGVTDFEYEEALALSSVDADESLRNQARVFAPLDEEQAIIYAEAMAKGDEFPPIVAYRRPRSKKVVIIDGNHRFKAAELADKGTLSAYVLKNPSREQTAVMTFDANTKHGKPTSLKERIIQAAWLVQTQNAKPSEAARALSIPAQPLYQHLKAQDTEARMKALGIKPPGSTHQLKRLGHIRSDVVLAKAAELVQQSRMGYDASSELVTSINRYRSEADQLAAVERFAKEYEGVIRATAGGKLGLPRDFRKLQAALTRLTAVPVSGLKRTLRSGNGEVPASAKDAVARQVERGIRHLNLVKTALGLKDSKES